MERQQFTYKTQTENKRVILGKLSYDDIYFVDTYPEYTRVTSMRFRNKDHAIKRFELIKKRVFDKIIK